MKLGVKALIGGGLLVCAVCTAGMMAIDDRTEAVLIEEVYTVRPGDTLWNICEEYVAKNTGTVRYILEYKDGVYENNPWLMERKGMIYPGDRLKITYWVKGDNE
ncbi:MAG: LysM peptidoglycan-binding domain-containing protein [Selenomonas noxia]